MFDRLKKYLGLIIAVLIMLIILVPFIINVLYKIDINCGLFIAEWTAGDALSYYGTVLSFIGTIILSALALWQNHIIRLESEKHEKYLDKMQMEKNKPCFSIENNIKHKNNKNLEIKVCNISENLANRISVSDIKIIKECGEIFYEYEKEVTKDFLQSTQYFVVPLGNLELVEENMCLHFTIVFFDKFNYKYTLKVEGKFKDKNSNPVFEFYSLN